MSLTKCAAILVIVVAAATLLNAARSHRPTCGSGDCLAPIAPLASPLPPPPCGVDAGRRF